MRGGNALRFLLQLTPGSVHRLAASACAGCFASSHASVLSNHALCSSLIASAFDRRGLLTSAAAAAAAAPSMQVHGDLSAVLSEVDTLVSREGAGPKDIADAAMALTYLQARGDRRLWGKIFEGAAAAKSDFDAASLTSFLWAASTAGVGHFRTTYELTGAAGKLLGSFTPAQLATVVEALGSAGVNDVDLFKAISARVVSKRAEFSASQLSKILCGFAAAGCHDLALTKAVLGALGSKAGADATAKDLSQVAWALAKMGRADAAALTSLSKALSGKLAAGEAPQDILAALWAFAHLNHKPDATLMNKAAAAVKGAVAELSAEQQVYAAWSFALLGQADKELYTGLFSALGTVITTAPDSLSVPTLGALAEAQLLVADKLGNGAPALPEQVQHYIKAMHGVVSDAAKTKAGAAGAAFKAAVADATARAMGARYKPEIAAAVTALPKTTKDGLPVEMGLDNVKVAVLAVDESGLSSSSPRVPLGPVAAQMELLRGRGYAPAVVAAPEFSALPDSTAKAKFVLSAIKAAAPGASSQLNALEKKLSEPFDPYAE